jgi:hypothetical protein
MARPEAGLLASGTLRRAFPGGCGLPVAAFNGLRRLSPGHSGGTAPVLHRTSLGHRPYLGRLYPLAGDGEATAPHEDKKEGRPDGRPSSIRLRIGPTQPAFCWQAKVSFPTAS